MAQITWNIDPTHSYIGFKVKHMMFTNVKGQFTSYTATIVADEESLENASINFEAKVDSINTSNVDRDTHLKSADFFDAAQYPNLTFKSQSVKRSSGNNYKIEGVLEMHGVSKPLSLDVEYSGVLIDPWGNTKAGLIINGIVKRSEWNLKWNSALETGGVLVGEDIKLDIELQLIKL